MKLLRISLLMLLSIVNANNMIAMQSYDDSHKIVWATGPNGTSEPIHSLIMHYNFYKNKNNFKKHVNEFLDEGIDINLASIPKGTTALKLAIQQGLPLEAVQFLVERGATITPDIITYASQYDADTNIMQYLRDHLYMEWAQDGPAGIDNPIHNLIVHYRNYRDIENFKRYVDQFLAQGIDINLKSIPEGTTALKLAIQQGLPLAAIQFLVKRGATITPDIISLYRSETGQHLRDHLDAAACPARQQLPRATQSPAASPVAPAPIRRALPSIPAALPSLRADDQVTPAYPEQDVSGYRYRNEQDIENRRNIAVLSYGSLVNQPESATPPHARLYASQFLPTTITLPVSLSRLSSANTPQQRITAVVDRQGTLKRVYVAKSSFSFLPNARNNLAAREGVRYQNGYNLSSIFYMKLLQGNQRPDADESRIPGTNWAIRNAPAGQQLPDNIARQVAQWAEANNYQAVIWASFPANINSQAEVARQLRADPVLLQNTQAYVNNLPDHAQTPFEKAIIAGREAFEPYTRGR